MRILLDTHTLLWHIEGSPKLSATAREAIELNVNQLFFSIASLWEIAIKVGLNKSTLEKRFGELEALLTELDIATLPIAFGDTQQYLALPLHHRDPFDRIIIAQSITNSLTIVSADAAFDVYPIQRLWEADSDSDRSLS